MREFRRSPAAIRFLSPADPDTGRHRLTLKAITPGVVDDYGSVFMPDVFTRSLDTRLPTLCWAHDWAEPLGRGVDVHTDDDGSPIIRFELSDPDAVPMVRRAWAQIVDGTITDCSVGFSDVERRAPAPDELERWPGAREIITRATLDEVSLVLRGAVPGAKVLALRSGLAVDDVLDLAARVTAGTLSVEDAQAAARILAGVDSSRGEPTPATPDPVGGDDPTGGNPDLEGDGEGDDPEGEDLELVAASDALDAWLGRSRL